MTNSQCNEPCETWSRVTGYFRPVKSWNRGKKEEFKDRKTFKVKASVGYKSSSKHSYYDPQLGVEIVTTEINGK